MEDKFPPYRLGILNENDSWSLFKEMTFGSATTGAIETPKLVEIGKDIVKRCGGLPLALIFLGRLLGSKKKEDEWKNIRDTKIWHEFQEGGKSKHTRILPSLRLSYDHLPSHLKQCFSYCCLFPKDWEIRRETLIGLWMAEGFVIESPGENAMSMEDLGNAYFHNLLSNFFFQVVERNEDGDIETCKMHDLVHDLARSVVGKNECLIVEIAHDVELISESTRRLNLIINLDDKEMLSKVLEALKKAKKLRTVFVNEQSIRFDIGNAFKENKKLRVLDWIDVDTEESTSSSIGGLKHLRYLDGYGACFPKGIGRLCFLQTLAEFNLGDKKKKRNASVIQELEGLNLLTGDLSIKNLQNVTNGEAACRANLKEKKNLHGLTLSWDGIHDHHGNNHEAVLERLRPHPNLRTLEIKDFKGAKLPRWIEEDSSCLPNLVDLTLYNCKCEQVAGFGALPSLRSFTLSKLDKLQCLGNELYYSPAAAATTTSTSVAFPSLKTLILGYVSSLQEWVVPVPSLSTTTANCFPLLEKIYIMNCPLLSTITPTTTTIFPSLKVLLLQDIHGRAAKTLVTNHLNSLTSLTLHCIPSLISLPHQGLMENNNTLLSLHIKDCPQFKGFLHLNRNEDDELTCLFSSSLQSLTLCNCPALRFYPNIHSLTSLRELEIQECKESKFLQDELTCLSSSSLENLGHVKILKTKTPKEVVVFEWRKPSFF